MQTITRLGALAILLSLFLLPGHQDKAHASTDIPLPGIERSSLFSSASFPPATIRVRITGKWQCDPSAPYTVETINFNEYIKNVLPNEWEGNWPYESYKAGAMAVKMYAWYWISQGGKWSDADVVDSVCDQVYKPGTAYGLTNQAVDETWYWTLVTADGQPFQPYHKSSLVQCGPPLCMSQTGSRDLALAGSTWDQILNNFYPDAVLSNIRHTQAGYALALEIDPVGTGFRLPLANLGLDSRDFKITGWLKIQEADHRDNEAVWCASSPQESTSLPPSYLQGGLRLTLSGERLDLNQIGLDSVEISSLCSREFIADGAWHFFKIDRSPSDSSIRLSVDGNLAAQEMNSSPGIDYMEFDLHGWIDEVQVVDLSVDQLLVNYSFDEGIGIFTTESLRGQSVPLFQEGMLGSARWVLSDLFLHQLYLPILVR